MMERIAIFHPEGNIANNPHLSALVRVLHIHGYAIDIFSRPRPDIHYQPDGLGEHIRFFLLPKRYFLCEWVDHYVLVIGVDDGLIFARNQAEFLGIPYAHISYELFFDDEISAYPHLQSMKNKMCSAMQNICFAIIQDKVRAELYVQEYKVDREKIIMMPVAGADVVMYQKSHYLHSLFNLDKDKKILLYMGSLDEWAMTDWLLAHAYTMPENWVLILHERYGNGKYDVKLKPERVFYTAKAADNLEELKLIIQSADCCAALYKPKIGSPYEEKNIQFIGLASGKFSTALQHGIPVLVQTNSIMGDLVRKYGAGIEIEKDQDLSILDVLFGSNNIHSACHKLFTEKLSINNFTVDLINCISFYKTIHIEKKLFASFAGNEEDLIMYMINISNKKKAICLYFCLIKIIFRDAFLRIKKKIISIFL